jgi:O-antigen/teichoic acid export membrane protein
VSSISAAPDNQLTHSGVILILSNLIGAVLGFSLSIVVGRGLGEAAFGSWTFCLAWAAILTGLCEFGLDTLLTRDAARSQQDVNQLLFSSLAAKLILVTLTGAFVMLAAPSLGINPEVTSALRVVVLVTLAGVAYGSFSAVFRAFGWMQPILWLNVTGLLVQLIGSIWIIRTGGGVLFLIWMAALVDVSQLIAACVLWYIRIRIQGGGMRISRKGILERLKRALPFALAGAISVVQLRSSVLMLGYLRGQTEVGWFGAASRFSEAAKLIPYGIFGALYPAFATEKGAAHFRNFDFPLQALAVGLALALSLLAHPILLLSYGANFVPGVPVLIWLGTGLLPSLLNGMNELYLYAVGDEIYANRLRVISLLAQAGAGVLLIFKFGAAGAAISLMIGEITIWFPLRSRVRTLLGRVPLAN